MNAQRQLRQAIALLAAAFIVLCAGAISIRAVETLSTGVGQVERQAQPGYSVRLIFAQASGPYLANVNVEIRDAGGKVVVSKVSEGPWFFAKLPAGSYTVLATRHSGEKTAAAFTVSEGRQSVVRLTW